MTSALAALRPQTDAPMSAWVARITACWRASFEAIVEVGHLLIGAKEALPHGDFGVMVEGSLPFTARTAQMLMEISRDKRLANAKRASLLPTHWTTLHKLTKLDDAQLERAFEENLIRPDMERADVARALKNWQREAKQETQLQGGVIADLKSLAESGQKFACILADPPWSFEVWSGEGKDRAAENHYPTMSQTDIEALPVEAVAAENCALFLWAVMPQLPEALRVIDAWGFSYKTCGFAWVKQTRDGARFATGMGYWTRANAELCLLATRGAPVRLNADVHQVIASPRLEHSRKPDEVHDRIERLVGGPYLELYARRARANWTTWGNEIPFVPPHDPDTGEIIEPAASAPAAVRSAKDREPARAAANLGAGSSFHEDHGFGHDLEGLRPAIDVPQFLPVRP